MLGGEDIQVECHIERTQGQEVRRQSELLKGHRRGMTELPTRTSAEKSHLNRTDCYSFPVPSLQAPQAGRIPQGQHVGSAASLREKVLLC